MSLSKFLFIYIPFRKTYLFSTLGFTAAAFTIGSLSWWTPNFFIYLRYFIGGVVCSDVIFRANLIFGIITCVAGFVGVVTGSTVAQIWRMTNPRADSLVCGLGLVAVVPFLYVALNILQISESAAYPLVFITVTLLCLNWALLSDILLSVIAPNRRSTASAFQILVSHLCGDAVSPYIIGQSSSSCNHIPCESSQLFDQLMADSNPLC
ncbi:unnamed protein product [Soboliphyme baturini]|uniref:Sphingolipid transporter spinster homolog 2 n=1 Tax=Soboliphyme baturini TaxID=241478 RepID=A0A183I9X8_9BILA|nr:unnamed protein product [Soboliphyme baturini]